MVVSDLEVEVEAAGFVVFVIGSRGEHRFHLVFHPCLYQLARFLYVIYSPQLPAEQNCMMVEERIELGIYSAPGYLLAYN